MGPRPLLGLVATAALGFWLAGRALTAGAALAASPGRAADLPDAVAVLLLWTGCAAAAWYALTCALALLIRLGRAAGATTSGLEDAVRRWGFPVLRRAVLTTVTAGAGLSLTVVAAGAAPTDGEPALPQDLGWGADVVAEQPAEVGTQLGEAARSSLPYEADTAGGAGTVPPLEQAPGAPRGGGAPATDDRAAAAAPANDAAPAPTAEAADDAAHAGQEAPGRRQSTEAPGTSPAELTSGADTAPGTHETASAPVATAANIPTPPGERGSLSDANTYRVHPGDSLWSIAAAHLGEHATTENVARAWPEWYRANRPALGPDPHLIHPGQLLHVPDEEAS
jgi:nucleoid-associated protein YgaU